MKIGLTGATFTTVFIAFGILFAVNANDLISELKRLQKEFLKGRPEAYNIVKEIKSCNPEDIVDCSLSILARKSGPLDEDLRGHFKTLEGIIKEATLEQNQCSMMVNFKSCKKVVSAHAVEKLLTVADNTLTILILKYPEAAEIPQVQRLRKVLVKAQAEATTNPESLNSLDLVEEVTQGIESLSLHIANFGI